MHNKTHLCLCIHIIPNQIIAKTKALIHLIILIQILQIVIKVTQIMVPQPNFLLAQHQQKLFNRVKCLKHPLLWNLNNHNFLFHNVLQIYLKLKKNSLSYSFRWDINNTKRKWENIENNFHNGKTNNKNMNMIFRNIISRKHN